MAKIDIVRLPEPQKEYTLQQQNQLMQLLQALLKLIHVLVVDKQQ